MGAIDTGGNRVWRRLLTVAGLGALLSLGLAGVGGAGVEVTEVGGWAFGEQVRGLVDSGPAPAVSLPKEGGGPFTASAASAEVRGVLSSGSLTVRTEGSGVGIATGFSRSSATAGKVSVGGNLVTADQVASQCRAGADGAEGSVSLANLRINGARVALDGTGTISFPGGRLVVNEQVRSASGGSKGIIVNALRVTLNGALGAQGNEVIVAQVGCRATASTTNTSTTTTTTAATTTSTTTTTVSGRCPRPCTIFGDSAVPGTADAGDEGADVELGVRFYTEVPGQVVGVRYYKSSANTGRHTANLWAVDGTLLATATFAAESDSGWQEVAFAQPVPVAANTRYVASYHTAAGHYSFDGGYFASRSVDNPPLHAPADSPDGNRNGVYAYGPGPSLFPPNGNGGANYWVDVLFVPAS